MNDDLLRGRRGSRRRPGGPALALAVLASLLGPPKAEAAATSVAAPSIQERATARGAPAVSPAPTRAERFAGAADAADALLDSLVDAGAVPGISGAVAVDGEVTWSAGHGWADLESRTPVTPLTRFRVGSVSKPLTAAAVGLLVEEGRLDLDAPVQRYVPDFPEKRWPITTRQLAGHLAGIRHYRDEEFLSRRHYEDVASGLEIFADDTLQFEPGSRYSYSSYGWNLVSAVVEGAAGEPFLRFMRRRVLEPLGLRHTVADQVDSIIPFRTRYYRRIPVDSAGVDSAASDAAPSGDAASPGFLNAPFVDNSYKWAGGGYLSTPEDLVRFGNAHLGSGLLRPATRDELWTAQRTADGESTGYGIGWQVGEDETGRRFAGHGGGSVGGTTILLVYPEERVVVALVSNLTDAPVGRSLAARIAGPFIEASAAAGAAGGSP